MREKLLTLETMNDKIFIPGIGWCIERTIYRLNETGINEPYTMYEPITK